jgi:hypothetical protein
MSEIRTVEALSAVEWYDGVVAGFIRLLGGNFLCVMLAFDAATARRRYMLVPIAPGQFPVIGLEQLGDYLQTALHQALAAKSDVYLSSDEPVAGGNISIEKADRGRISLISTLRFPRIDDAVLPSAHAEWL